MQDLINRLKNLKSATNTQVDKIINDHSYDTVLKELKDDGISVSDLSDDEFKQILAEEVKKTKTFAKGALADPTANDDLYDKTKYRLLSQDIAHISEATKLRKDYVEKVIEGLQRQDVFQLNQLARIKGIGIKTLEKVFNFSNSGTRDSTNNTKQQSLFDY